MHIVHKYKDTNAQLGAVIGIFFDREKGGNADNPFLEELWENNGKLSLGSFLSTLRWDKYWQYEGSLTTPPCSEGIKWTVIEHVQPISDKQLQRFKDLWAGDSQFAKGKGNNRNTLDVKGRPVYYYSRAAQADSDGLMAYSIAGFAIASLALIAF